MNRLNTPQAQALRKAMLEARRALDRAHEEYQHAFAVALDVDAHAGVDDEYGLVQKGRAYAAAVNRYSEATMAWLSHLDSSLRYKRAADAG